MGWHRYSGEDRLGVVIITKDALSYNSVMLDVEVTEYRNLKSTCSTKSYYECLAQRFADLKNASNTFNEINCPFNELCAPFSLPFENGTFPLCQNNTKRTCFERLIEELQADQNKHCMRTCQVKEFKTVRGRFPKSDKAGTFGFQYRFANVINCWGFGFHQWKDVSLKLVYQFFPFHT